MKMKYLVRVLLGSTAAIAISNTGELSIIADAQFAFAGHSEDASMPSDSLKSGRSGKLRGPLFTFLTQKPFTAKVNGRIGQYLVGFWPGEKRATTMAYQNPRGFIEVTQDNQHTLISEHFRLRDFLTHDQASTWPKYLVLREELVDKLELVILQLESQGIAVRHMAVMSGFRTPQYNARGGESSGRSDVSRHMFGDAADVFVDNNGDGRMDDLNRDGRVDHRDARVILDAVERVERKHPELAGGVGVYRANAAHGPFAHVDVRGWRARWGLTG
jgi:uncharacterized protein YcbK (DUF882 family)